MGRKRRFVELTHEECYQSWRALKVYLEQRRALQPTDYNDIALTALEGAMGKIQFYLTKDYAGSRGLELTNAPVPTLDPFKRPIGSEDERRDWLGCPPDTSA